MTREEARICLKNLKSDAKLAFELHLTDSKIEALEVTIQALEQEQCEDVISRQAALEAMMELPHEHRTAEQRARTNGIVTCRGIVDALPSNHSRRLEDG